MCVDLNGLHAFFGTPLGMAIFYGCLLWDIYCVYWTVKSLGSYAIQRWRKI